MNPNVSDEVFYVEPPDIPAGMTINAYRRSRPPVKKVWIVAMIANVALAARGIQFYKHNPNG